MRTIHHSRVRLRLALIAHASLAALATIPVAAQQLQPTYSPPANNGGGAQPGRADVIDAFQETTTITGDYNLRGTSGRPFDPNAASIAERAARGDVVSGFEGVQGRSSLALGVEQQTLAVTYPDQIRGTRQTALVFDNAALMEMASVDTRPITFIPTDRPVYGDLRIANISQSEVTIATGDKAVGLYDRRNFAVLGADSGSTLYNVTNAGNVTYDSVTATFHGDDQDGLSQQANTAVKAPVTQFSGVAFGNGDRVTDLASLRRYNTEQIALLTGGTIAPDEYERRIRAAATTMLQDVVVRTPAIPAFQAPPTTSDRLFMALNASNLTTTADAQLVGVFVADGNSDGISTLILARGGSTITNNGTIVQGGGGPGIRVTDAGSTVVNTTTGVIGIGYETLDRSSGAPGPTGLNDTLGATFGNIAVRATDNAGVLNRGIINVANRDISSEQNRPQSGKANNGVVVSTGATAINEGVILIGGAASAVADAQGLLGGAAGLGVFNGGTATNAAGGVIRVGTSFAGNRADLATLTDVLSTNFASGMASVGGGGAIVNDGAITIGSLAQNATGMRVGGDGNTALNTGTITIAATALTGPSRRNAGISVLGGGTAGVVSAVNSATGRIEVGGVNSVGLLVENGTAGGSARAVNDGVIDISGGVSVDRLRNFGIFVGNAASSAVHNGQVVLRGQGAIGIHARGGGGVTVGPAGTLDFQGTDQIGYYLLGAGSTITAAAVTDVDTARSTGLRVEGGANARGAGLTFNVSGANAFGVIASGASQATTFDAGGATFNVSGANATGVRIEGGATGSLTGTSNLVLSGAGAIGAVVDGQAIAIDGTLAGAPSPATTLASAATLRSTDTGVTGYVVQNTGKLNHSGTIAFAGTDTTDTTGIRVIGAGSATNTGTVELTGGTGTGVAILSGGTFANNGVVRVAGGTGILIDGLGSTLGGAATAPVTALNGVAAVRVVNGASLTSAGNFIGGGTAHAVLVDTGAGAVVLGAGTLTTTGIGNGIENAANSSAIRLNGTVIQAAGSGSGIRTGVSLDPASATTITASGTGSTGFTFAGPTSIPIASNLTLGSGYAITASGVGTVGVRLRTTGDVTIANTAAVTNAQGGSALVAGPARQVTNTGTLRSSSTTAPVVDLTGGTIAFTNTGTIGAASLTAGAITGGNNGQSVTLSGGAVTGAVRLGTGADSFTMTGGTLTGSLTTGAGNDTATFRGLTDANLAGVTSIDGGGSAGGRDVLDFQTTTSTGTRRLTGFNDVNLTGSTLTADGALTLAGGTFTIDASSTFFAGAGANPVVGASTGGNARVVNAGRIDLTNGGANATDRLTIRGDYVGQGGVLALQTILGGDGSPSDQLIIDGGTVSGCTSIAVTSIGGLGAATTGNGIQLVGAINGGRTTATTTRDAFTLAGERISAGAFEYRLYASDLAGTGEGWFLRTQAAPTAPGTQGPVTFRPEVALIAGIPSFLRQADLEFLATYHRRMGDKVTDTDTPGFSVPGRLWGRFIADEHDTTQGGTVSPRVRGERYGFQIGVDLFQFGTDSGRHDLGIYGGRTTGDLRVSGFAGGLQDSAVGTLDPKATYAGVYWTYLANNGLYVDTVVQRSWYDGDARSIVGNDIDIDGNGVLASMEAGFGLPLAGVWTIEPQVQLIGQGVSIDPVEIPAAVVTQDSDGYLTGRVGLRLKAQYDLSFGKVQPYARANLWKVFKTTDRTIFATPAAITSIDTRNEALWGEAGAGLTVSLSRGIAAYGEATYRFDPGIGDDDDGRMNGSTGATVGLKFNF